MLCDGRSAVDRLVDSATTSMHMGFMFGSGMLEVTVQWQ